MCSLLNVARSAVYKKKKDKRYDRKIDNAVIKIFNESRRNYGTRKIKVELGRRGIGVSRRMIGRIMGRHGLVSKYTLRNRPKHGKDKTNRDKVENLVSRDFSGRTALEVVVSDLTYVRVGAKWHYICLLLDIGCRKIIGHAVGCSKDAGLVSKTFYSSDADLSEIQIFHTDRGSEFKNKIIDDIIVAFDIKRSLSAPGAPLDNAVAEAMYKVLKTEFVFGETFDSLDDLELKLFDYVHWYNNVRIHGSLDYLTPNQAMSSLSFRS